MSQSFQINLRGIIDLLANHLSSSPCVFVRELLQNAVDAISARRALEPEHEGQVRVTLSVSDQGAPQLAFCDDGIGLTEEETHRFLSTIGESSKRGMVAEDLAAARDDFIGQFGIGLLSCFVVSEEILMVSRSARSEDPRTIEWRGRQDGTYEIRRSEVEGPVGTTVYLSCRPGCAEWFRPRKLEELLVHFGVLLPFPITLDDGTTVPRVCNPDPPPWRLDLSPGAARDACLGFAQRLFGRTFFDAIPIRNEALGLEGMALVLPQSPRPQRKAEHRVYVRHMFVADRSDNLLPDWAFFVSCIVDSKQLRPTASRESFYQDDQLDEARAFIGDTIREYLLELERSSPQRLQAFIDRHERALKALAAQDAELLAVFADWLPFETSLGPMTFGAFRQQVERVRYVSTVDAFRQISSVAAAQGLHVINGGYAYDSEVLEALRVAVPEAVVQRVEVHDIAGSLGDPEEADDEIEQLAATAGQLLAEFECRVALKRFVPHDVPALYLVSERTRFARTVAQTADESDPLFAGLLGAIGAQPGASPPTLCLNVDNPLVRRLSLVDDPQVVVSMVRIIYLQTLLMGRHPLSADEMRQLTQGLQALMDLALRGHEQAMH
ncbi:MAG: HSP90 family protein [Deltaproteobacteria bacterium]|nr:HSP90 family protein [Deltaproteobacteria bacterium]